MSDTGLSLKKLLIWNIFILKEENAANTNIYFLNNLSMF